MCSNTSYYSNMYMEANFRLTNLPSTRLNCSIYYSGCGRWSISDFIKFTLHTHESIFYLLPFAAERCRIALARTRKWTSFLKIIGKSILVITCVIIIQSFNVDFHIAFSISFGVSRFIQPSMSCATVTTFTWSRTWLYDFQEVRKYLGCHFISIN